MYLFRLRKPNCITA